MDLGFRELVTGAGVLSSWIIAFTTTKVKLSENEKKIEDIKTEHRNAINRLEEKIKNENKALEAKLELKRKMLDELKYEIKDELTKIKEQSQKFLQAEKASETFVSKTEWNLLIDNMNLQFKMLDKQYGQLDKKLDDVIAYIKETKK